MNPIIKVEGLGKRYKLGAARTQHLTQQHSLAGALKSRIGKALRGGGSGDTFWALSDVSFEVMPGEVVGIIGHNGAGKSTLLKILSRIVEPTAGRVELHGRVGSLLEVGTGFHPELTGRENIYLNGAILGMKRAEIEKKFDEIVAFAEVEKFLDTPVKKYSSGMYTRLAFAVAANLEPEILIVDEVLSVGDAVFQRKCLGKMGNVAREGRTVLFVSHNMGAVAQLCSRAIIMSKGRTLLDGEAEATISAYLKQTDASEGGAAAFEADPRKDVQITSMTVVSPGGEPVTSWPHTEEFGLLIEYRVARWPVGSYVCADVLNEGETRLLWASDVGSVAEMMVERPPGVYRALVTVPGSVLAPGRYYFTGAVVAPGREGASDVRVKAVYVDVTDGGSLLSNFGIRAHAATSIPLAWRTERLA
jgi:lipopolysaccharide transport system ATP-binding protein